MSAAALIPRAARFHEWLQQSEGRLRILCPDAFEGDPLWPWPEPSEGREVPPSVSVWSEVLAHSDAFQTAAPAVARGSIVVAFCLLRDWQHALRPLLEALGTLIDDLLGDVGETLGVAGAGPPLKVLDASVRQRIDQASVLQTAEVIFAALADAGVFRDIGREDLDRDAVATALRRVLDAEQAKTAVFARFLDSVAAPLNLPPRRQPSTAIASDLWTDDDQLGYRPYAEALAAFIRDPRTRTPLTIGIKAPWGAGKTSLMRMVKAELKERAPRPAAEERAPAERLTNQDVLRFASAPPEQAAKEVAADAEVARRHTVVWFNAWKYQSGDQLWAGLAHAIVSQVTAQMEPIERERFWAQLNLRRIDASELRQRVHRAFFQRLTKYAFIVPATVVAAGAAALQSATAGTVIAGLGIVGAAADITRRWSTFVQQDAVTAVPQLVRDPGYAGQLGFLHLVQEDLERILKLVTAHDRPLVVFVDDLDRCSYTTVAQVVEALNVFLSGDFKNCVFVIGMEPDLVAAQIHVAYEKLFDRIEGRDGPARSSDLGWRFLEKMVQLPLALPPPDAVAVGGLVEALIDPAAHARAQAVPEDDPRLNAVRADLEMRRKAAADAGADPSLAGLGDVVAKAAEDAAGTDPALFQRVAREVYQEEFSDAQPEVRAVILEFLPHLGRNPREVKRFVNVFRFYAYILFWRETAGQESVGLRGAGKLAALAIRGPELLSVFGTPIGDGTAAVPLLALLEAVADDDDAWRQTIADALGDRPAPPGLTSLALRRLVAADPPVGAVAAGFL